MSDPAQLFNQALDALDREETPLAIDRLQRLINANPADHEAAALLADVFIGEGRREDAEIVLVAGTNQAPDALELWLKLADLRLQRGAPELAVAALKPALHLSPGSWEALYLLGNAFSDKSAWAEAVKVYRLSLESNPFEPSVWHNFAVALTQDGKTQAAAKSWETYLTVAGDDPDAETIRAEIEALREGS